MTHAGGSRRLSAQLDLCRGELDELAAVLGEPGCTLVAVGVDARSELCDLLVVVLGAFGPAGQRLFGEVAVVAAEDPRERAEPVQPCQLLADVFVAFALVFPESRELVGSLCGLD